MASLSIVRRSHAIIEEEIDYEIVGLSEAELQSLRNEAGDDDELLEVLRDGDYLEQDSYICNVEEVVEVHNQDISIETGAE